MTGKIIPQQYPGYPGARPPKGWVPPLGQLLSLLGAYDEETGYWVGLPLQALTQQLILAEKQYTLDRIDRRNGRCSLTMQVGDAVGTSREAEIEVPEDELWYLRCHEICVRQQAALTAGDLICNFRVSSFPKTDDTDKLFYNQDDRLTAIQAAIAAGDVCDSLMTLVGAYWDGSAEVKVYRPELRDFAHCDELGTELRLVGGDKLTLVVTVANAALAGGAVAVDLTVWGRRAKILAY